MKCRLEGWKVTHLKDDGTDVISESACCGTKVRVHREDKNGARSRAARGYTRKDFVEKHSLAVECAITSIVVIEPPEAFDKAVW